MVRAGRDLPRLNGRAQVKDVERSIMPTRPIASENVRSEANVVGDKGRWSRRGY